MVENPNRKVEKLLPEERLGELDTGFEKFPELYREYGKALRDNKWMDYDDQMVYAKKILEFHEDVRTHFQNRFPYICVDEAQDTSKIQHAIIQLLARKTGNLFMVGDEDQSIYGFREACPENFLEKRESYAPAETGTFPAKIALNANFRTRREITGFTNRLFSRIMTQRTAGMDYLPEDELVSSLPYDYTIGRPVTALVINPPAGTPVADCRKMEAEQAAEEIGILLKAGFTVEENGGRRPVRPGDICILMRSAKNREQYYIDALRERGIGARSAKNENLLEVREVKTVVSYLAVLANPMLDLELAEVLALGEPTTTALTEKPNLSPAVKPTTAVTKTRSRKK